MLEETTPLLGRQQKATRWLSISWLSAVVFCLSAAGAILNVPLTRLIEDRLCSQYVRQGAPTEELCKTDKIQSRLAYLNGCLPVVEAVLGLVAAFPFGVLADRVGRKPIIILSMTGTSLSLAWELAVIGLPRLIRVEFILAGPLFAVVGGGNTVLLANLYSIASDLVVQSDRASAFFLLAFASLVGASVGPAISSICMEAFSPWVSAFIAFFANLVALIPLFFVPETLTTLKQDSNSEQESEDEPRNFPSYLSHLLQLGSFIALLKSSSLVIVLATFLTAAPEVLGTSQFLAQYISKRFDWPLARTGYLLTLRGVIHMVVLLFTLPLLSKVLLRYQPSPVKDLTLARVSVAIAAVGALCMASSQIGLVITGLAIHSLGSGLAPLCRSLATSYVVPQDTSKLNTVIGIVQTTGSLFAGPAFAWLFETGMKLGGTSLGLPYYGLAGSFALCLVGLVFVHPPAQGEESDET
ncbi:Major facilitator superfamily domain, general substrate transporter [Penicillium italicum]|uniref:Major facilitator superfamily domain, general substrate transporter n=1 Tax=Penicillium italicum TaxID=40296 RepID=A0A0A2LBT4_PENIT|nr:Major facilitator superfamily domain, general substrate transporter [Penicillium italicum]